MRRLVVDGPSMLPTLAPGDRVLVVRARIRRGDLIAVLDPRDNARTMVKRVASVQEDGVEVAGDNADASTDSRHFGRVPHALVVGRAVYRYAPSERAGRLSRPAR